MGKWGQTSFVFNTYFGYNLVSVKGTLVKFMHFPSDIFYFSHYSILFPQLLLALLAVVLWLCILSPKLLDFLLFKKLIGPDI